jgi:hypothetical protein
MHGDACGESRVHTIEAHCSMDVSALLPSPLRPSTGVSSRPPSSPALTGSLPGAVRWDAVAPPDSGAAGSREWR